MHPVWDKIADWAEKDFERSVEKLRKEQSTRRVGIWIVLGLVVAYGLWANFGPPMSGSYCEYPDPYGRATQQAPTGME